MKRIIALLVVLLPVQVMAAPKDIIKMEGLFPPPYMAYDELRGGKVNVLRMGMAPVGAGAHNTLIIGANAGSGIPASNQSLKLGEDTGSVHDAGQVTVRPNATLYVDGKRNSSNGIEKSAVVKVKNQISFDGSTAAVPVITFADNLQVRQVNSGVVTSMDSLEAENVTVTKVNLFPTATKTERYLPKCDKGSGDSYGKIRWGKFRRQGDDHARLYLFCGDLPEEEPEPPAECVWKLVGMCVNVGSECNPANNPFTVGATCTEGTPGYMGPIYCDPDTLKTVKCDEAVCQCN